MQSIKSILIKKKKEIIAGFTCLLMILLLLGYHFLATSKGISFNSIALGLSERRNSVYLSDINYITDNNWSYNGWSGHPIRIDKNQDGGTLSLLVDGEKVSYAKGIGLHAKGQVTFDVSAYSTDYPRFVARLGLDASKGAQGSIWFKIFTSNDGETWDEVLPQTSAFSGATNSIAVDINIEGAKYLRIYVDPNGGDISSDHGTIANARLVTLDYTPADDFVYDKIHKLDYYDNILKNHDIEYNYKNNIRLVKEREFVRKLGYYNIQNFAEFNSYQVLDWILDNNSVLEEVIEVGEIQNS